MAVSVESFSFSMVAQPDPGVNSSVCWLSLLQRVYLRLPLYCLPSFSPISHLSSIRRPYITFKLPRSNIDTPQRLRNLFRFPATGCVTSFRCTTLNGIFGRVKRSKLNKSTSRAGVLKVNTLAPYPFIICLEYVLLTSIHLMKERGFTLTKVRSRLFPAQTITDMDYAWCHSTSRKYTHPRATPCYIIWNGLQVA